MSGWSNRGFSLLELLVILVLIALVSATVTMRWSGVGQKATLESAVRQLEFSDAYLRRYARSHGILCSLAFDLRKNRLRKQFFKESQKNPPWEALGRGVQIGQIQTTGQSAQKSRIELTYQCDGTSATYGIELLGPYGQKVWLVVAGVSGQITRLKSQKEYQDALQIVSPQQ